jgi:hypothetical protein
LPCALPAQLTDCRHGSNEVCQVKRDSGQTLFHFVFFLEFVYAASRIDQLCLAGKERVAIRANFHENFFLVERVLCSAPHAQRITASS